MSKVLIVDDEESIRTVLSIVLAGKGYEVQSAAAGHDGIALAISFRPDTVLLDMNLPDISGIDVLRELTRTQPSCAVIIMTAFGTIRNAVEATRMGAYDYLEKPVDNDALLNLVGRTLEVKRRRGEVDRLGSEPAAHAPVANIIGSSAKMIAIHQTIEKFAQVDGTVLIAGESGTGKELAARAIHFNSARREGPFVTVNCGAIPKDLVESEFFGHVRGAFTDARSDKMGKFEQAHGGTIFLDEVGELPLDAQVKFLRVLGEREIVRIGGQKTIPIDVRVVAATNKELAEEVKRGCFRDDLYWRLAVLSLRMPPLRERLDDVPHLVDHFLRKLSPALKKNVASADPEALQALQRYAWPGNVRELESVIYETLVFCDSATITMRNLPRRIVESAPATAVPNLQASADEAERRAILHALQINENSRTRAARYLGISRKTLFNKMKRLDIRG